LRLPHRPQGLRRRDHRRAGEPRRRRRRRPVRGRSRAVQRVLRLVRLQGRPGVPADHPRAAGALAPARRLRGARRVSGRPVPDGAGAAGGPAVRPAQGGAVGLWLRRGLLVALLAVVVALPFVAGPFGLRLANLIGMYALVVLGLVLLTGYAGLASLGQAAFVGTSAYTAAILASRFGVNPWLSIAAGVVASVAIAWLMGAITLRLKGHFLALATLAWGLVITGVLRNWIAVTGGNTGFGSATGNRIPPLTLLGDPIRGDREYYVLVWGALLLTLWLVTNLMRSRGGRAGDQEPADRVSGGGQLRRRRPARQDDHVPRRGRAGGALGRASHLPRAVHRPEPRLAERQHRLPDHGRDRRADERVGRPRGHRRLRAAQGAAPAGAARPARTHRQLRDRRVRLHPHPRPAVRAARARADGRLPPAAPAREAGARGRAATAGPRARAGQRPVARARGRDTVVRRPHRRAPPLVRGRPGRGRGAHRPERGRQDHGVQPHHGRAVRGRRARALRRAGHHAPAAPPGGRPRPGAHVPAPQPEPEPQ